MTTDELNAKYKLLKQIAHGEGRSFTAQECASGRAVLVHFLSEEGRPPDPTVATLIDRLSPRDRSKILEILAVNLSTVVVTEVLEDFESFGAWLRGRPAMAPGASPEPPQQSPPRQGEFTKLFEPPADSPASTPPTPSMPAASPSPPQSPQGSFTELFRTPPEPKASPFPKPSPITPQPSPVTPPVEIRSVRMRLGDPAPPRPPSPLPSWPSSFEPPPAPRLPQPVLPSPRAGEPIVKPPPRDHLPPPSPVQGWSGESDYTRQLRPAPPGPAEPPPPVVAAPPSPDPAPAATRSFVPLLLVLNIIVVIATGLILYFALKRR